MRNGHGRSCDWACALETLQLWAEAEADDQAVPETSKKSILDAGSSQGRPNNEANGSGRIRVSLQRSK